MADLTGSSNGQHSCESPETTLDAFLASLHIDEALDDLTTPADQIERGTNQPTQLPVQENTAAQERTVDMESVSWWCASPEAAAAEESTDNLVWEDREVKVMLRADDELNYTPPTKQTNRESDENMPATTPTSEILIGTVVDLDGKEVGIIMPFGTPTGTDLENWSNGPDEDTESGTLDSVNSSELPETSLPLATTLTWKQVKDLMRNAHYVIKTVTKEGVVSMNIAFSGVPVTDPALREALALWYKKMKVAFKTKQVTASNDGFLQIVYEQRKQAVETAIKAVQAMQANPKEAAKPLPMDAEIGQVDTYSGKQFKLVAGPAFKELKRLFFAEITRFFNKPFAEYIERTGLPHGTKSVIKGKP